MQTAQFRQLAIRNGLELLQQQSVLSPGFEHRSIVAAEPFIRRAQVFERFLNRFDQESYFVWVEAGQRCHLISGAGGESGNDIHLFDCFTWAPEYTPNLGIARHKLRLSALAKGAKSVAVILYVSIELLDGRRVNDFAIKLANVNGTGSASANSLIMTLQLWLSHSGIETTMRNMAGADDDMPAIRQPFKAARSR